MNTDVVIVGAGPVGLTAAHLLARYGVRVVVFERGDGPSDEPGAVCVDDEAMRIWQACGLERDFKPYWESGKDGDVVCRYINERGHEFLQLRQRQSDLGYPQAIVIRQQDAARVLWQAASRVPAITLRTNTRFIGLSQTGDGVIVTGESNNAQFSVTASWVVGCDGKESSVRDWLGVRMPTRRLDRRWLVADVSDDGSRPFAEIHCGTTRSVVSVPLPGGHRRIEHSLPCGDDGSWIECVEQVRRLLAGVLEKLSSPEIEAWRVCRFRAGVANSWRVGRVFLTGDAAHVSSPFAGQGMCGGLRDASNLCFKIAGVLQGWLDEAVLDSYEAERKPHQEHMIKFADRLGKVMLPDSQLRAAIEQRVIGFASGIGAIRSRIEMRGASVRPIYRDGFFGSGTQRGCCLPQPSVTLQDGSVVRLDSLLGPRMTWIVTGAGPRMGYANGVQLRSSESILIEGRDFEDPAGALQKALGCDSCALIRPDRFIHTHIRRRERHRDVRKGTLCLGQRQPA